MDRTRPEGGAARIHIPPGLQAGPGRAGETGGRRPGPPPGHLDMPPPGRTPRSSSPGNALFPVIRPSAALRRRKKPYIYKEMKNFFHETISTPIIHHSIIHSFCLRKEPFICKDLRLSLSLSLSPRLRESTYKGLKKKERGKGLRREARAAGEKRTARRRPRAAPGRPCAGFQAAGPLPTLPNTAPGLRTALRASESQKWARVQEGGPGGGGERPWAAPGRPRAGLQAPSTPWDPPGS